MITGLKFLILEVEGLRKLKATCTAHLICAFFAYVKISFSCDAAILGHIRTLLCEDCLG